MADPGLFREPIKELEVGAKTREITVRMVKERKALLHEREGGHLRDEDDYQLLREVRKICHQAERDPPFGPPDACRQILGLFKMASLDELLDKL